MSTDYAADIAELRRRIERLEARATSPKQADAAPRADTSGSQPTDDVFWAVHGLKSRIDAPGAVLYTGSVTVPGASAAPIDWQYALDTDSLLERDWSAPPLAAALAALGSPVRLRLLQAVARGTNSIAELAALDGLGTTGQVYHHVNQLIATGWVRATVRGHYGIPPERAVPLLTVLLACGGTP